MSSKAELLRLCCRIELGKFAFNYVNEVFIVTNVENLTDTCTITLPRALFYEGKPLRDHLKRGDEATVQLGYNDELNTVFRGFVKNLKTGTPLVVECEDNMFLLKKVIVKPKTYKKVSVRQLIDEYLPKEIERSVLDFDLGEFIISDETNLSKILEYIMDKYRVRFFFKNGKFYAAMPHAQVLKEGESKKHVFEFQKNIISDNVQYQYAEDVNMTIVYRSIQKDNSMIEVRVPQGGDSEIRTFWSDTPKTKAELQQLAKDRLKEFKYDGLTGYFEAFGVPFVQVSDRVKLIDRVNGERNGKTYLVKAVKYTFGMKGYRQNIELSYQL